MLETFKARLKAKSTAAGANLSQKRIDAIADRLHKKFPEPKDDAEHDAHIDTVYDAADLKEFAQADDYQRTKEAKEKKDKEDADKKAADEARKKQEEGAGRGDDEPAWFKSYREANDAKLNGLLAEKQQQTLQEKLTKHDKLKDIPAKFYIKRVLPKTDEEIEAFAEEVAADYTEFQPAATGDGTEKPFVPGKGSGKRTEHKPSDKELDGILSNIKI